MLKEKQKLLINAMAANDLNVVKAAASLKWHRHTGYYWIDEIIADTGCDPRCFYDLCELMEMVKEEDDG